MPRISSFYGVPIYLDGLDTGWTLANIICRTSTRCTLATRPCPASKPANFSMPSCRGGKRVSFKLGSIHHDELIADGSLAVKGQPGFAFDPLK